MTGYLGRLCRSLYAWTIALFFAWQFLFAVKGYDWFPSNFHEGGLDTALTASLICSVHLIIVLNTIAFMLEVTPIVSPLPRLSGLSAVERRSAKRCYRAFVIGLILSTFISGILAL